MKKILYIVMICFVILSCKNNKDSFTIKGFLKGGEGKYVTIQEVTPNEIIIIDSVQLNKDGEFSFTYKMPYQSFYNIVVSPNDFIMLLPNYQEKISITGDYNNLSKTYQITGSPDSQLLWQLNDYTVYGIRRLDSIKAAYDQILQNQDTNYIKKQKIQLDSIYLDAYYEQQDFIAAFIEKNGGSLSTLIALYKTFNTIPLIRPDVNFDFYELIYKELESKIPDNPHTLNFGNTVQHMRFKYGNKDNEVTINFGNQQATEEE